MSATKKRIGMFFDGTWNEPGDNTSVWRMKLLMAHQAPDGTPQIAYYDTGVGTDWYNRLGGGAFAQGLSENVRQAYQWLMEHYETGDEVYVFGFSRGAFTARSLTGMIAKCGLLRPGAPMPVLQVFERYSAGEEARPLYRLEYLERKGCKAFDLEEQWLLEYSTRIPIKFIGVWDTVGTLGIPLGKIRGISRATLKFHHTRLSKIFEHAYQALAIDEHRKPYAPTIWMKFIPKEGDNQDETPEAEDRFQNVEQRWFVGAHSNVGGGYRNDPLAQVPLAWLQSKAADAGLAFRQTVTLSGDEHLSPVTDSYSQFLKGVYKVVRFGSRYYREIGRPEEEKERGSIETVNEKIDGTVLDRWKNDPSYRPKNLTTWAARTGKDVDSLTGEVST